MGVETQTQTCLSAEQNVFQFVETLPCLMQTSWVQNGWWSIPLIIKRGGVSWLCFLCACFLKVKILNKNVIEEKLLSSPDACFLPRQEGPCGEKLARWYYDMNESRCVPFYYGGCQGNANRFATLGECEKGCPAALLGKAKKIFLKFLFKENEYTLIWFSGKHLSSTRSGRRMCHLHREIPLRTL
jgi:hypothetical protein